MEYLDPNLPRQILGWHSPRLGMDMPIVRYGHWGRAMLLFPSAQSDFLEYERFFVIKAMEPFIREGKVQVFSIDSINRHCWMDTKLPVSEQVRRQALYSGYVEEEVVPHIRRVMQSPSARVGTSGVSFGAFHAANAFFRRPDLFDTLLGLSGFYDLGSYLEGHSSDDAYFNNPAAFLRNLGDAGMLNTLRNHSQIHLVTGQGKWERPELSGKLAGLLGEKGIPHNLDLWGHDVAHDWEWWRKMYTSYVGHRLGY